MQPYRGGYCATCHLLVNLAKREFIDGSPFGEECDMPVMAGWEGIAAGLLLCEPPPIPHINPLIGSWAGDPVVVIYGDSAWDDPCLQQYAPQREHDTPYLTFAESCTDINPEVTAMMAEINQEWLREIARNTNGWESDSPHQRMELCYAALKTRSSLLRDALTQELGSDWLMQYQAILNEWRNLPGYRHMAALGIPQGDTVSHEKAYRRFPTLADAPISLVANLTRHEYLDVLRLRLYEEPVEPAASVALKSIGNHLALLIEAGATDRFLSRRHFRGYWKGNRLVAAYPDSLATPQYTSHNICQLAYAQYEDITDQYLLCWFLERPSDAEDEIESARNNDALFGDLARLAFTYGEQAIALMATMDKLLGDGWARRYKQPR